MSSFTQQLILSSSLYEKFDEFSFEKRFSCLLNVGKWTTDLYGLPRSYPSVKIMYFIFKILLFNEYLESE